MLSGCFFALTDIVAANGVPVLTWHTHVLNRHGKLKLKLRRQHLGATKRDAGRERQTQQAADKRT